MKVKQKKVPKLRSIRVNHILGCGPEIQYKIICPADFDMVLCSGFYRCPSEMSYTVKHRKLVLVSCLTVSCLYSLVYL